MAQRVTVTIPDGLHERLKKVKDHLNVSRVCQEAIDYEVRLIEINSKEASGMEKLVDRLSLQAEQESKEWREQGVKDGQEGATNLDLADFRLFEKLEYGDSGVMRIDLDNDFYSSSVFDYIKERWLEADYYRENGGPEGDSKEAYLEGWVEGALSVWAEIKVKISK